MADPKLRVIDTERPTTKSAALKKLYRYAEMDNVAEELDEQELNEIGDKVIREYEFDEQSRDEWREVAERAMEIALQKREPKNYPFEGASNVKYPLLTTAALQFGARAYPAIVDPPHIVKTRVVGEDPYGVKKARAHRVSEHMSYQLLFDMEEWEEDTDALLHQLPIVGCCFRKVYYSKELDRPVSEMVPAMDLVVNNNTQSIKTCPRITHLFELYPYEVEERIRAGTFLDEELGVVPEAGDDDQYPHEFVEQHRLLDLDGDGYEEPWIVTVHKEDRKVFRIVANYDPIKILVDGPKIRRIKKRDYFIKYSFIPDPNGGFYDIGFGKLLDSLSDVIDTTVNQMLDAGHLQNAGGGFIGSGLRLKKGVIRFRPGVYQNVEALGSEIRDSIVNMDHPGPSSALFNLLGLMIDAGKDVAAVKDILTGDMPSNQPATTTLALIEQGLKVFTAIYKRIYRALTQEFRLLFLLNSEHLEDKEYSTIMDETKAIAKEDYDPESLDVMPVADPKFVTDLQRAGRVEFLMQFLGAETVNQDELLRRIFDYSDIEDSHKLIVPPRTEPDPAMILEMQSRMADVEKTKASAVKDLAEAEKDRTESMKLQAEAATANFQEKVSSQLRSAGEDK